MPRYYSSKEVVQRLIWAFVNAVFFRYSPRMLYGWRNFLLRSFGATIGKGVQIFPSARIMFPWMLHLDDHVVISWDVKVYNLGLIRIGSHTVVSQYAHLCGGNHDYTSAEFTLLRTGLIIGSNVWIAADAFIGPGVVVGDNSVIAACAVVVTNVDRDTLVGGHPAKPIRKIQKPLRMVQ